MDLDVISTVITVLMATVGFTMVFRMCRPFNRKRTTLMIGLVILFLGALLIMPEFFEITLPDYGGWLVLAVFSLLIPSVIYTMNGGLKRIYKTIDGFLDKMNDASESRKKKRKNQRDKF